MAGAFLLLYESLPGGSGLLKGISFALLVWFFRVPTRTLLYSLVTGLGEMIVLGVLYGAILQPLK